MAIQPVVVENLTVKVSPLQSLLYFIFNKADKILSSLLNNNHLAFYIGHVSRQKSKVLC